MPPVGFEPTNLAGERPQTYSLDNAATGTVTFSENTTLNRATIVYVTYYQELFQDSFI